MGLGQPDQAVGSENNGEISTHRYGEIELSLDSQANWSFFVRDHPHPFVQAGCQRGTQWRPGQHLNLWFHGEPTEAG